MRQSDNGYRGLATFVALNIDRALASGAIIGAVLLAAWIQSV